MSKKELEKYFKDRKNEIDDDVQSKITLINKGHYNRKSRPNEMKSLPVSPRDEGDKLGDIGNLNDISNPNPYSPRGENRTVDEIEEIEFIDETSS